VGDGLTTKLHLRSGYTIRYFIGNRVIRLLDFFSFCGLVACGLVVYELFQLVMPNRTFETNDLSATALGALLPAALGWILFQRNTEVE
jgi:hypothetical protein